MLRHETSYNINLFIDIEVPKILWDFMKGKRITKEVTIRKLQLVFFAAESEGNLFTDVCKRYNLCLSHIGHSENVSRGTIYNFMRCNKKPKREVCF